MCYTGKNTPFYSTERESYCVDVVTIRFRGMNDVMPIFWHEVLLKCSWVFWGPRGSSNNAVALIP
jgi:hypothetical protein